MHLHQGFTIYFIWIISLFTGKDFNPYTELLFEIGIGRLVSMNENDLYFLINSVKTILASNLASRAPSKSGFHDQMQDGDCAYGVC